MLQLVFVHDGFENSVEDYYSKRVGVVNDKKIVTFGGIQLKKNT